MAELPPGLAQLRKAIVPKTNPKTTADVDIAADRHKSSKASSSAHNSPERDASPKRKSEPSKNTKPLAVTKVDPEKWSIVEGRTNYALWSCRLKRYVSEPAVAKRKESKSEKKHGSKHSKKGEKKGKKGKKKKKRSKGNGDRLVKLKLPGFYPHLPGFSEGKEEVFQLRNIQDESVVAVIDLTGYDVRAQPAWKFPKKKDGELEDDDDVIGDGKQADYTLKQFAELLVSRSAHLREEDNAWDAVFTVCEHPSRAGSYAVALTQLNVKLITITDKHRKKETRERSRIQKEVAELQADHENSSFKPKDGPRTRRSTMDPIVYNLMVGKTQPAGFEDEGDVEGEEEASGEDEE